MRFLIIGADSPIGAACVDTLSERGAVVYGTTRRRETAARNRIFLDLADDAVDEVALPAVDIAFFCAAVSGFARCRTEPELAERINVTGTSKVVEQLTAQGTRVVLLSSTAVFDFQTPHVAADVPTCPRTVHGEVKAKAERVFLAKGALGSVLRLTKVLTPDAPLLLKWIAALRRHERVRAFSDLHIAPISLDDATDAVLAVAGDSGSGIYQMSGAYDVSYFETARHLAKVIGCQLELVRPQLALDAGIPENEIPRYTTLESSRLEALVGRPSPDPYKVIEKIFAPQMNINRVGT